MLKKKRIITFKQNVLPMKRNYYYLVAGLQDISLDANKLSIGLNEFVELLRTELHPEDYRMLELLFLPNDHKNLLNILEKKDHPLISPSVYQKETLEENIKEPVSLLPYLITFIQAYKEKTPVYANLSPENELTTLFYQLALSYPNEFLRKWFEFDMNIKNVLVAISSRKYHLPYEHQVIGNTEVSDAIRKSNARDFGLGNEYPYVEDVVNIHKIEDIHEREWNLDLLRWKYLDEVTFFEYFTAEKVLAYVIKLRMVERWLSLDKEMGRKMFLKLLDELKASYSLPDKFSEK